MWQQPNSSQDDKDLSSEVPGANTNNESPKAKENISESQRV